MSIEVRTYDGDAQKLSQFVVKNWLATYLNKVTVPDWSPDYFDWQMTGTDYPDRHFLLSAWKGTQLVGTTLAMPFPLWLNGHQVDAVQGSWFAVDPEFRRQGIGLKLSSEMNRRQKERNLYGRLGYMFEDSKQSLGPKFWKSGQTNTQFIRKMYLWARVLNGNAVCQWTNKAVDKFLLNMLPSMIYNVGNPPSESSVRDFKKEDLESCQELINQQAKKTDLAILWTSNRLLQQLNFPGITQTLVMEREGHVVGFLNFHLIGLFLKGRIDSAIIDLFACDQLTSTESNRLLVAALQRMKQLGVDLALMREFAAQPYSSLLKARFIPQFSDSRLMLNRSSTQQEPVLKQSRKIQILWR